MKKDKVYELRIEEDDEVSGIDSISLVSEPAIEINWVAFNKQKPQEFHIPDGEDEKYLQKLKEKAQSEQDLLDQGYKIYSIEFDGKTEFATSPNEPSNWDENEFQIRYKYILSPRIKGQSAVISTTRQFCKELVNQNYVWRIEDMDALTNDFGESALVWRGGYNCRHNWAKIKYKKDATIVNKASVNKGKVYENGFPTDLTPDLSVMGYDQPLTITDRVLTAVQEGTAAPSTIRNLGLSKQDFAGEKVSIDYDDTLSTDRGQELAKRLIEEGYIVHIVTRRQDTDYEEVFKTADLVGIPHSRIHFTNGKLKWSILKELGVIKHYDNNPDEIKAIEENAPDIEAIKFAYDNILPNYVDQLPTGKTKQDFQSFTDYPQGVKDTAKRVLEWTDKNGWGSCGTAVGKRRANQLANGEPISLDTVIRMYSYLSRHKVDLQSSKSYEDGCGKLMYDSWGGEMALRWAERKIEQVKANAMSKQKFQTDDEKKIVIGPAMVPNMKIFRKDKNGDPYYVFFKPETIRMIAEKYMKNKYIDNNDQEHNGQAVEDVYVYESWIKESEEDKSNKYGFGDLPVGTWFVAMKVKNDEIWQKIKKKELNGFSVSGFFEEVEQFRKEKQFLFALAKLLKEIK